MSQVLERCAVCEGLVDHEDLFCANCGTEIPEHDESRRARLVTGAKNFACRGCGATTNYDASSRALKCPFCGSIDLIEDASQGVLAPDLVVPFRLERAGAELALRDWLGRGVWRPNDLRQAAQLASLTPVYIPYWIFSTHVHTYWTADTSQTPGGAWASWYPLSGERSGVYPDLWVPASDGVSTAELDAVGPFSTDEAVPADRVELADVIVEQFAVSRRYARPRVQGALEELEARAVAAEVPGRSRNVHVNVLMEGATSRAALIPIYVLAYTYREKLYRFVLNGQTGKATGTAPVSSGKVGLLIAFLVVVLVIIVLAVAG